MIVVDRVLQPAEAKAIEGRNVLDLQSQPVDPSIVESMT